MVKDLVAKVNPARCQTPLRCGYLRPPASPAECIFAQSTLCLSTLRI
jgi:hypothetical protein